MSRPRAVLFYPRSPAALPRVPSRRRNSQWRFRRKNRRRNRSALWRRLRYFSSHCRRLVLLQLRVGLVEFLAGIVQMHDLEIHTRGQRERGVGRLRLGHQVPLLTDFNRAAGGLHGQSSAADVGRGDIHRAHAGIFGQHQKPGQFGVLV